MPQDNAKELISAARRGIVFAWYRPTPPFFMGGAEVSMRLLAEKLAAYGFHVTCFGSYTHPRIPSRNQLDEFCLRLNDLSIDFSLRGLTLEYSYGGMDCRMVPAPMVLSAIEIGKQTDVVFTAQENSDEVVKLARRQHVRTIGWIHSVSAVGFLALQADPTHVLYTSEFVRRRGVELFGRDGFVFYPPFRSPITIRDCKRVSITLVNPVPAKGLEIFVALTDIFQHRRFVAVEGWEPVRLGRKLLDRNVRYVRQQSTLDGILSQTRLLLVPSEVEEGFGRVVTEAGLYGIPSIASARGGLVEAVGRGGILVESRDIRHWADAIQYLDDDGRYQEYSDLAKQHATTFLRDPVRELIDAGILV